MFCSKCGAPVSEGSKFCPYCGNSLKLDAANAAWRNTTSSTQAAAQPSAQTAGQAYSQANASAPQPLAQTSYAQKESGAYPKALDGYGISLIFAIAYCILNFFYLNVSTNYGVSFGCNLADTFDTTQSLFFLWLLVDLVDYAIPVLLIALISKYRNTNPQLIFLFPVLLVAMQLVYMLVNGIQGSTPSSLRLVRIIYFGALAALGFLAMRRRDGFPFYLIGVAALAIISLIAALAGLPPFANTDGGTTRYYLASLAQTLCMMTAITAFAHAKQEAGELPLANTHSGF